VTEHLLIDWGSSSVRAWRVRGDEVLDVRRTAVDLATSDRDGLRGVLRDLRESLGDDLTPVACGMIGSASGLRDAGYLDCPVALTTLADWTVAGGGVRIVPGLACIGPGGEPDVMRGEETQLLGLGRDGLVCLPGTHSKWAVVEGGRVVRFATSLTGELRALLLGRGLIAAVADSDVDHDDLDAFDAGLRVVGIQGGVLHHLFAARSRVLQGVMPATATASWLSGLLVGHEVAAMTDAFGERPVTVVGAGALTKRYLRAIGARGTAVDGEVAARRGLLAIARRTA